MLQGKACYTIFKSHLSIVSAYAAIIKLYCKVEVFRGISCISCNLLGYCQISFILFRFRLWFFAILRIDELCFYSLILYDAATCSGSGCCITILVCFALCYCVANSCRQSCGSLLLIVLQGKACYTIFKSHLSIASAYAAIIKLYCKCEVLSGISRISCNLL